MYSSYYTPKDGRQSTVLTDHDALHRDANTHKSIQSNESVLRPIDLETIMSSKGVVKYWYLHRPKTMEYVHQNVTKIQTLGRAFAVRSLKKKHGMEYVVAMAKADAVKREAEKMAELTEEERKAAEEANRAYDARVEESRRLRMEQMAEEERAEAALRARQAEERRERQAAAAAAEEERKAAAAAAEEERKAKAEAERLAAVEAARIAAEEAARVAEEERLAEEQRLAEEEAARVEAERVAEEERLAAEEARLAEEEAERVRQAEALAAEEAARQLAEQEEKERVYREKKRRAREEQERAAAAAALAEEEEKARVVAAQRAEKYEQSLSKDVPVVVRRHGPGRVVAYNGDDDTYTVRLEQAMGGRTIKVQVGDVNLDDDRILSPRTKVDTPFGAGEVVGLDPHVGCYAVNTEISAPDGEQFLAFVQIGDVAVHVEEPEERAIVENASMPIPDEITLVSARIVDNRVVNRTAKKFIQYKLEIKTTNYGTVYCWKRYSTFRSLCERLQKEAGYSRKEIPMLPKRQIMGNFSAASIGERAEKLNVFLSAAVRAEHLQWGVRVDDQIAVYKRRIKRPTPSNGSAAPPPRSTSRGIFSSRRR